MWSVFKKYDVVILIVVASQFVAKFALGLIIYHYHVEACAVVCCALLSLVMDHLDFVKLSSNYCSLVLNLFLKLTCLDIVSASL